MCSSLDALGAEAGDVQLRRGGGGGGAGRQYLWQEGHAVEAAGCDRDGRRAGV